MEKGGDCMKQFFFLFLTLTVAMGGTALGADMSLGEVRKYPSWRVNPVKVSRIFLDGEEKTLSHPLYRKQEETMIAAEDLANIISGSVSFDEEEEEIYLRADALDHTDADLYIGYPYTHKYIKMDTTFYGHDYAEAKKSLDGVWYIPFRKMAEAVCYEVMWKQEEGTEYFMLQSPQIPRLTATADYDISTNLAVMTMVNQEQKDFIYGYEFVIQKWNGTQWQRAPMNREECYGAGGYELPGQEKNKNAAFSAIARRRLTGYGDGIRLSPGKYRICQEVWEKDSPKQIHYTLCAEFEVK